MDSPKAVEDEGPRYFTEQERVVLAVAHVLHEQKPCTLSEALAALWPKGGRAMPASAPDHCKKWRDRLFNEASVTDAPGRGRKPKLPDAVALEASKLVKAGYEVTPMRGKERLPARRIYFHSIEEAVRRVPRLKAIMDTYDISTDHLLRRMHAVDPGLHWGKMDVRVLLSKEHMSERQQYALRLLALIAQNPNFSDRMIWIDEVKIWFFGSFASDVRVWCDAHDQGVHIVVPGCGKLGGKPLCVSLYAAVNSKLGLVALQYSPSTTGFPDTWDQKVYGRHKDAAERKDADYEAPAKKGRHGGRAATAADFEDILAVIAEEAERRFASAGMGAKPVLSFDNASIHKAVRARGLLPASTEHLPLPPRSPDLHKVIEHTFGHLKPAVHAAVFDACRAASTADLPPLTVRQVLQRTLKEVAAAENIAADCESLKITLRIVGTDRDISFEYGGKEFVGTGGDWAPRDWR